MLCSYESNQFADSSLIYSSISTAVFHWFILLPTFSLVLKQLRTERLHRCFLFFSAQNRPEKKPLRKFTYPDATAVHSSAQMDPLIEENVAHPKRKWTLMSLSKYSLLSSIIISIIHLQTLVELQPTDKTWRDTELQTAVIAVRHPVWLQSLSQTLFSPDRFSSML